MKRKMRGRKGFTLAETLLAVLILLLVSSIVATGIPAAKNAYEKVVLGSNAQLLLSTTVNALRDELGMAWDVQTSGQTVTYFSADTGARSIITVNGNTITRQRYAGTGETDAIIFGGIKASAARPLVSEKAVTDKLYVKYDSVTPDGEDVIVFNGLKVYNTKNGVLAEMDEANGPLRIRVVSLKP